MRNGSIKTETVKASEARQQWSQLLNNVFRGRHRFLVEKSGIPVAAVVSAEDLERLNELDEQKARDFAALDRIGEAFKDVPLEELEREISRISKDTRGKKRRNSHGSKSRGAA